MAEVRASLVVWAFYLVMLLGENGRPMARESFPQRVGQPVSLRGTVLKSQGLFYVCTSVARIVCPPEGRHRSVKPFSFGGL